MATGDELLAAIYAEPRLDEHRRVYADWLSERGDPRGEFILLQLIEHDGRATKLSRERARSLIRSHAKAWLGPLDEVLERKSVVFDRGFPTRAVCKPGLRKPNRHFTDPMWATFEHLSDPPLTLIPQRALRSLRSLSLQRDPAARLLGGGQPLPNIQALEVRASKGGAAVIFGEEQALYQLDACLPGLTSIRFIHFQMGLPSSWHWAMAAGQLRSFAVYADYRPKVSVAGHWAQWLRGVSLPLELVTLGDSEVEVTLGHVEAGDWARAALRLLSVSRSDERVAEDLQNLRAHGITQVEVEA